MGGVVSFPPPSPQVKREIKCPREVKDGGGHVLPLAASGGEILNGGKDVVE